MHIILILLALLFLFPSSNSEARVDLGVSIGDEGLRIRKGKKRKADLYPFIFRIENIFMKLKVQSYLKPVFEYPH
jgi:hypothetical protein